MVIAAMGLVGGVLLQKFGARKLMIVAGIMWGLGWFTTGFATNIFMLYISFGILAGCASGFGYNPGVVTAVSWFPDRKGFASGMAVGVCGMASLIVAPLANFLLTKFNVLTAFRLVGGFFLLISVQPPGILMDRSQAGNRKVTSSQHLLQEVKERLGEKCFGIRDVICSGEPCFVHLLQD